MMLIAALLLAFSLAACSSLGLLEETPADIGGQAEPVGESGAPPTAVPTATAVPVVEEEDSPVSANGPSGCMAFSAIPEPNPTLEAIFPPPREDDHVKGAEDAIVTIIEYSDFQ
jgi:hypothetical protein